MHLSSPIPARRAGLARWSSRLAIFALTLALANVVLHRFAGLPTPLALNLFVVSITCAGLAIACGLIAFIQIWMRARTGAWSAAAGLLFSAPLVIWPLVPLSQSRKLPEMNDISTDTQEPPRFAALARDRPEGATRVAYPGASFALMQAQHYPDLKSIPVDLSVEQAHDLVYEAVRSRKGLNWRILNDELPTARPPRPGLIEAVERTLIMGYTDDIVIRIRGDDRQSIIDIRSKSRFGRHDLGTNASRIRRFTREIRARIDARAPEAIAMRGGKAKEITGPATSAAAAAAAAAAAKRPVSRSPQSEGGKSAPGRAPQDAKREPPPKDRPRG